MKITKNDIEMIVNTIIEELEKAEIAEDICIYYNNKRISIKADYSGKEVHPKYILATEENVDPHNYFEWAAYNHIISMSFEGLLYDKLNFGSGFPNALEEIFQKYKLYYEFGNAWNLTFYTFDDNIEVEYTVYNKPTSPIYIWKGENCKIPIPLAVKRIMDEWWLKSKATGDKGCCVIGAYMEFTLNKVTYHMAPCSPWQGEWSWSAHIEWVKTQLKKIGCNDISWHCGMLD